MQQFTKFIFLSTAISLSFLFVLYSCKHLGFQPKTIYSESDTIEINTSNVVFDVSRKVSLQLDSVLNDSRCPKGLKCVWEGNAQIQLTAKTLSDDLSHKIVLNTNPKFPQDTLIQNHKIKLLELNPYPDNKKPISYYDYRAIIVIEKE